MKSTRPPANSRGFAVVLLLAAILCVLFWKCFLPDYVHFFNDGPLGVQKAAWMHVPEGFLGQWDDLDGLGFNGGALLPDADSLLRGSLGPVCYSKFYIPLALWVLGIGAYFFFRRSGMSMVASTLGGLAACLTTNYFSNACWGASPAVFAFGMDFIALGILAKRDKVPFWVSPALAGLAVGLNVMEAADIGAMFSVLVAIFVVYQSAVESGPRALTGVAIGIGRTIIVAAFAGFIAAYAITELIGVNVTGVSGKQENTQAKAAQWGFATQWSLPKRETLTLIIPGLFGDRVDFSDERAYWGGMGRDASWEHYYNDKLQSGDSVPIMFQDEKGHSIAPQIGSNGELALPLVGTVQAAGLTRLELQKKLNGLYSSTSFKGAYVEGGGGGFMRHTGRGFYFGLLVVMIGLWAALQSLRKNDAVFTLLDRKFIWFWSVTGIVSVLFAHGRFSPFASLYYWIYSVMPYSSTVRSPEKFLHVANFAAIILFAYGINGLNRRYFEAALTEVPLGRRLKDWWSKADAFDKRWVAGTLLAIVVGFAGWLTYAFCRQSVDVYLQDVGFDPRLAPAISGYSLQQVGWFLFFLVAGSGLLLLIFSGTFAGRRAKWGGFLIGLLLVADLVRADLQYSNPFRGSYNDFLNYKEKYETYGPDAVIKFLAEKPYEHRVSQLPFEPPPQFSGFSGLYGIEWTQQLFRYYNIQSLDVVQMSRMPQDIEAFERAFRFPGVPVLTRRWELTNTRYLLGPAGYLEGLNQQFDPVHRRFRIYSTFDIVPRPFVQIPANVPLDQLKQYAEMLPLDLRTAFPATDGNGDYAVFEFTGALPRAKLYSNWQTNGSAAFAGFTTNGLNSNEIEVLQMRGTNDFLTLKEMASPSFDPAQTVLISQPVPASTNSSAINQSPGEVNFVSYSPTNIKLKANPTTASVLLLNDRYDSNWQVWVDGKRAELLRCNFIMRGVFLEPGQHDVEFRFRVPIKMLYVNIAAIVVGLGLIGYVAFAKRRESD
jgi:hypothetical protein